MDLRKVDAIWLTEHSPKEIGNMVREQAEWDEQAIAVLDESVTAMVVSTIAQISPDLEDLNNLQALLRTAQQGIPSTAIPPSSLSRWRTLSDCLHIRASLIQHGSYEAVQHMLHVDKIVDLLQQHGEISQQALLEQLQLQPANLTRVLNLLEDHRVIQRSRKGKEKLVKAGENLPQQVKNTTSPQTGMPGRSLFSPEKSPEELLAA